MTFLIRAAFWLSLVILFLPAEPEDGKHQAGLSTADAITVAQATLNDFTAFCARQPDVCAAGEVALENFTAKARYGAKQIYVYLDGGSEEGGGSESDGLRQAPSLSGQQGLERQELSALVRELQ